MKIIVAGSRDIEDYGVVEEAILHSGWIDKETEIVSGMARGVDMLGVRFAKDRGLPLHKFPANWNKYGKTAGMIRNKDMADFADALVAVWDGRSHGTKGMIDIARSKGLKVFIVRVDAGIAMGVE
jgi:hypothetical protein